METTTYPQRAGRLAMLFAICLLSLTTAVISQPLVSVRLANPTYSCVTGEYCLDVEFQADQADIELFGMNVRFFYDDDIMELIGFSDFQGGYGPVSPNPPIISTNGPAGPALFNFTGPAEFVNGAIQLLDENAGIVLSNGGWTKIFQICFLIDNPGIDPETFCPPIVWDLEQNPNNGGYLAGDDGVVMTILDPDPFIQSQPATENVVQFNWTYTGEGSPPYGNPVQNSCITLNCAFDLALSKTLDPGQTNIQPGDDVDFTIQVTNEANEIVSEVRLIDYIPTWFALNDPDWTAGVQGSTGQSASTILSIANGALPAGGLLPGQSVTVGITLNVDVNVPSDEYYNFAEIYAFFDIEGVDVSIHDVDSNPDTNDTNDPPGEDDIDNASICLLRPPVILGDDFVCNGDFVTYTVEDYNPNHQYVFNLIDGGGIVVATTPSSVTIAWNGVPGQSYILSLTDIASEACQATGDKLVTIEQAGGIACIDHTNISIDNECGTKVLSGMILTGDLTGDNSYQVYIIDMNGDTIPNGILTWEHVGRTFKISVVSACTGQSCWGFVTVEDKLPPVINCVCPMNEGGEGCFINCLQAQQFLDGNVPEEFRPTVVDNCGGTTLDLINVDLSFPSCATGYVRLTWKATDTGGNTASCIQQYDVVPFELRQVQFPQAYVGGCFETGDPDITGWPTINGMDLTDDGPVCNLYVSYWDRELGLCGEGRKIIRTWNIMDWCAGRSTQTIQTITLSDNLGPVITCTPDMQVGTNVWFCYANVLVPKPQVTDECSPIQSYTLTCPTGTVVVNGNSYAIQNLPVGTHTATWKVTDECGNKSSCSFKIKVIDNVPPVVTCHLHTVVSLTNERSNGITLAPADVFDDGSFDNCGTVKFRARRMDSCIDFDWTTYGACVDDTPGGVPAFNVFDQGLTFESCVPFACCDVGQPGIMVQLEVTDEAGNVNYCMVEVEVQDKLAPDVECPENIYISCEYPLEVQEGVFSDVEGNNDGSLDEDPLSALFGNMYDAFRHSQNDRQHIIINDPDHPNLMQPHDWGQDGWANDNCSVDLSVRVNVIDDCSGASFSGDYPAGAVKLITRTFIANDGVKSGSCVQRIWVIDYNRFHINDTTCDNLDPSDGVIWPCDVLISTCSDDLGDTGEPVILDDGCSLIGMTYDDERFDFAEGACYKILRTWKILDWCQFNPVTGSGLWKYTQTIKVADSAPAVILDAPSAPVEYCLNDPGISLPENNQVFLGENNPASSSCSVHVDLGLHVHEACSQSILYDVKIYLFNGPAFIQMVPETVVPLDENHEAEIRFNTQASSILSIQENGLPYNSSLCNDYHRVVWTVEDGCGNRSYADYLFRLEDCKNPTPVCIDGISTVIMPIEGEVTINASSFNASSFDDCTPGAQLLFSFSGTSYQPTFTYTCDNVPAFGVELPVDIWAADGGVDQNCNGQIEWSERNKEFCTTTIVITDNNNVCDNAGGLLEGEVITEQTQAVNNVTIRLSSPDKNYPALVTAQNGKFIFTHIPLGQDYTITPERNDDPRNGVSTLDLVRIQKHLLGLEPFTSPYQYIAADANNSKSVSAIDLIEIRKLILGLQDTYSANQSWRFVQKGIDMVPGNPWPFNEHIELDYMSPGSGSANDFIGVKIGDVNNSVQANTGQVLPRASTKVMNVKAGGKGTLEQGEEVEVVFQFPEVVSGFQWTMETSGLEFVEVSSEDIQISSQNIGLPAEGMITMSWNGDIKERTDGQTGMSIKVKYKVTEPGRLINMIDLTSKITHAEAYTLMGEIMDVHLTFSSTGIFTDFALYQNKPNPWNNQTLIGFHLPADAPATLTVYDVNGQVIKSISGNYKEGYNSVTLMAGEMPTSGVLFYRLESGQYTASKKMVLVH